MTEKLIRCPWGDTDDQIMQKYHDQEWGKLNLNEHYLYEMLVLESFQSGLSWSTVLHKRADFCKAFSDFNIGKVVLFDDKDFERLMNDKNIIRNKLKIKAAIHNAKVINNWHQNGVYFADFLTSFVSKPIVHQLTELSQMPANNQLSEIISREMKKKGFKFVGPTTIYSFLQGIGLINDHLDNCSFKY